MKSSLPWRAVLAAPMLAVLGVAAAQPAPAPLRFESSLEGYQRFTDEATKPWREVNEAVREAGGWRAYAREAAGDKPGETPAAAPAPPRSAPPGAQPNPSQGHGHHGGAAP